MDMERTIVLTRLERNTVGQPMCDGCGKTIETGVFWRWVATPYRDSDPELEAETVTDSHQRQACVAKVIAAIYS